MSDQTSVWREILEYAATYPSPHNSQPIKVKIHNETQATVYYDKKLGLPAESFGIAFGYVCAGIYLEILAIAAHNFGYNLEEKLSYDEMDFADKNYLHSIASVTLKKHEGILETDSLEVIKKRQTSRLSYSQQQVPDHVLVEAKTIAQRYDHILHTTTDKKLIEKIIEVNQKTLFYDLSNDAVRREIKGYLRYSRKEAHEKADGLSAECMALPGSLLKFLMEHHGVWSWPVIGPMIKSIYLNSMTGVSQIAWITGTFKSNKDYLQAGRCFIRIWFLFTRNNIYLHPFGSVITNERAHREFCILVNEQEKEGMAWMLFRFGYSKKPPVAMRRPLEEMIIT